MSTGTSSLTPRSIGNLSHVPPCGASDARQPAQIQQSAAPHGASRAAAAAGAPYTTLVALIPGQKRQVLQDPSTAFYGASAPTCAAGHYRNTNGYPRSGKPPWRN